MFVVRISIRFSPTLAWQLLAFVVGRAGEKSPRDARSEPIRVIQYTALGGRESQCGLREA